MCAPPVPLRLKREATRQRVLRPTSGVHAVRDRPSGTRHHQAQREPDRRAPPCSARGGLRRPARPEGNGAPCLARLQRASAASLVAQLVQEPFKIHIAGQVHRGATVGQHGRLLLDAPTAVEDDAYRLSRVLHATHGQRRMSRSTVSSRPKSHHSAGGGGGPHRGSLRREPPGRPRTVVHRALASTATFTVTHGRR